jgi:hypothetical protein
MDMNGEQLNALRIVRDALKMAIADRHTEYNVRLRSKRALEALRASFPVLSDDIAREER